MCKRALPFLSLTKEFYGEEIKEYYSKSPQVFKLSQLMPRKGKTSVRIATSASIPVAPTGKGDRPVFLQLLYHRTRCYPQRILGWPELEGTSRIMNLQISATGMATNLPI